jgi:pyruvate kinase
MGRWLARGDTVTQTLAPRSRKVKILATLGPASSDPSMIRQLLLSGADAFRINMSHGDHETKAKLVEAIRALEKEFHRPTTILFDLQGPKLRVGQFEGGRTTLEKGERFVLDRDDKAGDCKRVQLPHAELFESVRPGTNILIDDGKVRLSVLEADGGQIVSEVKVGGSVSDNKGVNVPDVVVPIPALTDKDKADLAFALDEDDDVQTVWGNYEVPEEELEKLA